MQATMLALISKFGYLALAALVFLDNVFPPIPSEVILPAAGSTPGLHVAAAIA